MTDSAAKCRWLLASVPALLTACMVAPPTLAVQDRPGLSLDDASLPIELRRGREQEAAGDPAAALETFDAYLHDHPQHLEAHLLRGRLLCDMDRFEPAERDLVFCVERAQQEPALHLALGMLYHRWGRFAPAAASFEDCFALAPEDAFVRNLVGTLEARAGRLDHARRCFEDAHRSMPAWSAPRINAAMIHLRQGRKATAAREFVELREEFPDDVEIRLGYADALLALDAADLAMAELIEIVRTDDPALQQLRSDALMRLGHVYIDRGEIDRAIPCLEASILESEQARPVFDDLARLYHRVGRADDAVALMRLSLRLDPRLVDRLDLAGMFEAEGREGEALAELRQAAAEGAADPELWWSLARLEEQAGEVARARAAFERMLDVSRRHPEWLDHPGFLVRVAERSFASHLSGIASRQRGAECLRHLQAMAERAAGDGLQQLRREVEGAGLPEDFLANGFPAAQSSVSTAEE